MRIRKRFLSLSAAITAPPPSDLEAGNHHNHRPPLLPVQHQQLHPSGQQSKVSDPPPNQYEHRIPPYLSDYATQIGLQPSTGVSGVAGSDRNTTKELESEKKREIIKTDDSGRKESILRSEASKHHDIGRIEGDRSIPIKKRRGSFEKKPNYDINDEDSEMIEGMMKPNPDLNTNDKCITKKNKKNGNRGNVILEGSRCSRVNGRGWRCGQQTLVGYSLCEHHLGKGRVRSMTSVPSRPQKVALKEHETKLRKDKEVETTLIDDHEIEDDDDDDDWEVESMFSVDGAKKFGKKKKLGVVKARSLSSLLSQIDS